MVSPKLYLIRINSAGLSVVVNGFPLLRELSLNLRFIHIDTLDEVYFFTFL